ncbi:MAG: hypothetical protein PVH19_01230, partial [Planctomycetia bacterium]
KIYNFKKKLPFSQDVIVVLLYKAKDFPEEMCRQASYNPLALSTQAMVFEVYQAIWHLKKPKSFSNEWVRAKLIPVRGDVATYTQQDIEHPRWSLDHHMDIPRFPGAKVLSYNFYPDTIRKGPDGKGLDDERNKQWFRANPQWMLRAAELLYQAELYDDAWRAYFEAIYGWGTLMPLQSDHARSLDALSVENAEHWHQAAKAAYLAGKKELAWDLLFKAAVFGNEICYKNVQKTAVHWFSGGDVRPPIKEPLSKEKQRKLLLEVVTYYKNLNVHPRAWNLVEQHQEYFDNPDKLVRELKEDWAKRLDEYNIGSSLTTPETYIYGQKVFKQTNPSAVGRLTRIKNPADITVPWAMEDKALKEVAREVKNLFKQNREH